MQVSSASFRLYINITVQALFSLSLSFADIATKHPGYAVCHCSAGVVYIPSGAATRL